MPHEMIVGGTYMGGFSGGALKAVRNSGVIEECCRLLANAGSITIANGYPQQTICHYNSQGKLKGGGTNDKKGGYRVDMQNFTTAAPVCANFQVQLNVNTNPSTVACVHIPVGRTFSVADVEAAFYASMTALKDNDNAKIARLT